MHEKRGAVRAAATGTGGSERPWNDGQKNFPAFHRYLKNPTNIGISRIAYLEKWHIQEKVLIQTTHPEYAVYMTRIKLGALSYSE